MPPPDMATALADKAFGTNKVDLTWLDGAGTDHQEVWRNTANSFGTAVQIASVPAGDEAYTDLGLTALTTYYYWLRPLSASFLNPEGPEQPFPAIKTYADPGGPMNAQALRDALQAWATAGSGRPAGQVIWRDSNGTKPSKDFLELNLVGPTKPTVDDRIELPGAGLGTRGGPRTFELTIDFMGQTKAGVTQLTADLIAALDDPTLLEALGYANLALGDVGQVIDITTALDTKIESRFRFTLGLLSSDNRPTALEPIEDVDFIGSIP